MPMLIEHIDKIAREKQRDVLFVAFRSGQNEFLDWETLPIRQQIIGWLESEGIGWECCGHYANENMMSVYEGQIYIDVPFERDDPLYRKVEAYLENPDGSMRHPGVAFRYLPLELAMKNAHHYEPGFWDRWAENF